MTKVYISGPISNNKHYLTVFNTYEYILKALGYDVVNPAVVEPSYEKLDATAKWSAYMQRDIAWLHECDAIYMLPGWEQSKGACIEHNIALSMRMHVLTIDLSKVILVDCDGTLLGSSLDKQYESMLGALRRVTGSTRGHALANWVYAHTWRKSNLPTNDALLAEIRAMRAQGYVFILWTNRFPSNVPMTRDNLGTAWELFAGHTFWSALKGEALPYFEGMQRWDDKPKYATRTIEFEEGR